MSVLFSFGTKIFSATGHISVGTVDTDHPASNVVDNVRSSYARIAESTGGIGVDLGSSKTPTFMLVSGHNIGAAATIAIQGSDSASYSSLLYNQPISITALADFWKDLRTAGVAARYWRPHVTSNSAPVRVGEIVMGTFETVRCHLWEYSDTDFHIERNQGMTEWLVQVKVKRGIKARHRSLKFMGPNGTQDSIKRMMFDSSAPWQLRPLVFIPDDTDQKDAWLLEHPSYFHEEQELDNNQFISFELLEQAPSL